METKTNEVGDVIVAFHIGRGGRFNNQGHLSFLGEYEIGHFTDDLFLRFEYEKNVKKQIKEETKKTSNFLRENLKKLLESENQDNFDVLKFLGFDLGEKVYFKDNGNSAELTEAEAESGVGLIDIDGDYDTTYTRYLSDCNEHEMQLIVDSDDYVSDEVLEYCKDSLGIEDEIEVEDED